MARMPSKQSGASMTPTARARIEQAVVKAIEEDGLFNRADMSMVIKLKPWGVSVGSAKA